MSAQIDHAAGLEDMSNDVQDTVITKGGITGDVFDVEGGIKRGELKELGGKRDLLPGTGSREIVGQDNMEAAGGVGEEQGEAGITIARFTFVGIRLLIL
jgi:hypothetical protein